MLGPVLYVVFRMYLAAARFIFNFVALAGFVVVLVAISIFDKPTPSNSWTADATAATTQQVHVAPCADVEQLIAESFGPVELCDRYYKSQQCQVEIETGFERAELQLSPLANCGAALPSSPPAVALPESFESKANKFLDTVPNTSRPAMFERLYESEPPTNSSLTLEEVRNTSKLTAFLAFAKPTGDALAGLSMAIKTSSGSVVLDGVPLFSPFAGIVHGVYQRTPLQECSVRLHDHSLCIELEGRIKCNVLDQLITASEQVCVDYLIR
jgi:hypothetical protein